MKQPNQSPDSEPNRPPNSAEPWPVWATEAIHIAAPDPSWPARAMQEQQELIRQLSYSGIGAIEHIGSTAVPGLPAKPIIDLIAEVPSFDNVEAIARSLRPFNWHYVPPELDQQPHRRFFIKVENNTRAVHLQLLLPDSTQWKEQVQFRDYLVRDKTAKEAYAALKQAAAARYGNDREAYTRSKSEFIRNALASSTHIRIIFATNNEHKVEEIQAAIGHQLEVISLRQAGIDIDIPEPHDTLEANASEKSMTIHRLTGENCFSEDTGLEVAALNGEPGVRSARYAGEDRAFQKNIDKLLHKLGDNPDRKARFRTVISLILDGKETLFEGICEGRILPAPAGVSGFGYDPVFSPEGEQRSFAEMSLEEKNRYSHRRKAADQLVQFLQDHLQQPQKLSQPKNLAQSQKPPQPQKPPQSQNSSHPQTPSQSQKL